LIGFGDAEALEALVEDVRENLFHRVLPELIVPGEWNGVQLGILSLATKALHQKASLQIQHPKVSLALGHLVVAHLVEKPAARTVLELEEFVVLGASVNQTDHNHPWMNLESVPVRGLEGILAVLAAPLVERRTLLARPVILKDLGARGLLEELLLFGSEGGSTLVVRDRLEHPTDVASVLGLDLARLFHDLLGVCIPVDKIIFLFPIGRPMVLHIFLERFGSVALPELFSSLAG